MKKYFLPLVVLASLSFIPACSNDDDGDNPTSEGHNHDHDHGGSDAAAIGESVVSKAQLVHAKVSFQETELLAGQANEYTASVMFVDEADKAVEGVTVTDVTPWMMTHGHGSFEDNLNFHQHDELGAHWMVSGIAFSMPGDTGEWILRINFTLDGSSDEVDLPIAEVK